MVDWKRIIVGNAFRLPSRDLRYYLDLALIVPLFLRGSFFSYRYKEYESADRTSIRRESLRGSSACFFCSSKITYA